MPNDAMRKRLQQAFDTPTTGGRFYSANSAPTASQRLNDLPGWDWTPARTHSVPGASTCLFPLALGCPPKPIDDTRIWIEPLIKDIAQIKDLPVVDIHDGQTGIVLDNLRQILHQLPEGDRVRCCDIQSPLGIAELMWNETFYFCLMEQPEAVHRFLDYITDFQIAFIHEFQRLAGDRYNPCGFPLIWAEGTGCMIADDTMSLVSPQMHAEFSLPYVNRIAESCGPIYYHSCTWREQYFDNVHQVKNVRSYNWACGDSVDFSIIAHEFGGKALLAPHLVIDMHKEKGAQAWNRTFEDEFDFFRYMCEATPEDAAMSFWFSNIREKPHIIERIYDYLHERGHTPQAAGL